MAYEIYWGAGSPNSWRTLLGLEVKGLKYTSKLLEFSKNEHLAPDIVSMNHRGQLPILKDGDVSIYESNAILVYLDQQHPEIPLFGTSAFETSFIWQRIFEIENYLRDKLEGIIKPIFFDDVQNTIDDIEKSANYVHAEFKILQSSLSKSKFIAGNTISAADIVLFPFMKALQRALSLKAAEMLDLGLNELEKSYPAISLWLTRIETLPGYNKTYPPNWKD